MAWEERVAVVVAAAEARAVDKEVDSPNEVLAYKRVLQHQSQKGQDWRQHQARLRDDHLEGRGTDYTKDSKGCGIAS